MYFRRVDGGEGIVEETKRMMTATFFLPIKPRGNRGAELRAYAAKIKVG